MANYIIDNRLQGFRVRIEPHQYIPVKIRMITEGKLKGQFEEIRLGYCSTMGNALSIMITEILAENARDYNLDELKILLKELKQLENDFLAVKVCPIRENPAYWAGK